jgi:hypothetical protein
VREEGGEGGEGEGREKGGRQEGRGREGYSVASLCIFLRVRGRGEGREGRGGRENGQKVSN